MSEASSVSPNYTLPPLKYDYAALEPFIDEATMRLHHDKHHQAYIDKVNAALTDHKQFHGLIIEGLMRRLDQVPEAIRLTVRNNGDGHANHQFFWKIIGPQVGKNPPAVSSMRSRAISDPFTHSRSFSMTPP